MRKIAPAIHDANNLNSLNRPGLKCFDRPRIFLKRCYIQSMTKTTAQTTVTVRNAKTGKFVTVRGAGSLKGSEFQIKKGVDLTKPIASQTLKRKG